MRRLGVMPIGLVCLLSLMAAVVDARERMAVLDLTPTDFDATEALLLSERLRYELDEMGRFDLVGRADLYAFIDGKGLDAARCDETCLQVVGRALGAAWVVTGNIRSEKDRVRIEASLFEVENDFFFTRVTRKADRDPRRLRDKEMRRLARELVPPQKSTGVPWWLLVLGAGGGAAWWATQSGDDAGNGNGGNGGGDPSRTGSADITGTFPDP